MSNNNVDYALSFYDLLMVDGFKEALDSENKKILDAILFTNGMDISLGYEFIACKHRTINKIEYDGIRVQGFERLDKQWLATGVASKEAVIKAIPDIELRKELRNMSRERTQDRAFD